MEVMEVKYPTKMITDVVFEDEEDVEEILNVHAKATTLVCYIHNRVLSHFISRLQEELRRLEPEVRFEERVEARALIVAYKHIAYVGDVEIHRAEGIIMLGDDTWSFVIQPTQRASQMVALLRG